MNVFSLEPLEARIAPATLSIAALPNIPEGDSGTSIAQFKVTLSEPVAEGATVAYATADGTATAGADYTAEQGTLTFSAQQTEQIISIDIVGDLEVENDETFTVTLSSPTNATITPGEETGTGTITDNDPKVHVAPASVVEGSGGAPTFLDFRVFLSGASPDTITVEYRTLDGTATSESDYDLVTGTLVFNPNETEKIVRVPINSDSAGELNEALFLSLTNPVNAGLGDTPATGTILNDDATLRVSDATSLEGAPGATTFAEFSVILEQATTFPVTVRFKTQDLATETGRALAGTDYDQTEGTLTFTGNSTQIVRVPIRGDNLSEGKETFLFNLSDASNAAIAAGTATGNIFDDERNVVSVSDAFIAEGDTGQANMVFVVSLQHGASGSFEIPYATENGTATSGATNPDFVAQQGRLTFSPGETAKVVTVPILGDVRTEEAETFKVALGTPTTSNEVFVMDGEAIGTITDNDPAITVTIGNARVAEGNAGSSQQAIFTVRLSDTPRQPLTVKVSTVDGSATSIGSEADFVAISERLLTFNPGAPIEQETAVTIIGDARDEQDETFSLRLSEPDGGHIGDSAEAIVTIANDEATLSVSDVTVTEGTGGTTTASFIVTLSTAAAQPVSVDFTTVDGTARSTGTFTDFAAKTERLVFAPGELTKTVAVTVQSDTRDEADESLIGRLQNATNASLVDADGTAVITDDDVAPTLSVADVAAQEGNAAPARQAVFTIKLSAPSERPVAVKGRSVNGTAVAGEDYTALPDGTAVTFAPGETEKTISAPLTPDTVDEVDETFALELFEAQFMEDNQPAGAVQFANDDSSAIATIINDDLTVAVGDASVTEGDSGTVELRFALTLSAASNHPVTLQFATSDGSAVSSGSGADYVAQSGSVTFAPGETTKEVVVLVNGDERNETNETLTLLLSAAQNAVLADSSAVGTILNDEITFTLEPVGETTILEESGNVAGVARFRIVRSAGDLQVPVSVAFTTQNGTALAGGDRPDYTARSGTVTFSGSEVSSALFEVPILADDRHENDETFKVVLSNAVNGSVASSGGELQFTIDDNDAAIPTVTIEDATIVEGDPTDSGGKRTLFFNVRLSAVNEANAVRVVFETEDGTARSVDPRPDYEKPIKNDTTDQTVITFAPGETVKRIGISVLGDLVDELDNAETFLVRLTEAKLLADGQPVGDVPFTGGDNTAIGTIQDNDVATLSFDLAAAETTNGVHVGEGTGATTLRNFTVKLSHESESGVTVNLAVVDGSATRQTDLTTPGVTPDALTFAPFGSASQRMQTVTLHIAGDAVDEANETLELRLADPVNAVIDATRGHVDLTIDDDDPAPVLAINNVTIEEGDSGTKDLVFTVTLSGPTEQIVKYDFATVERTAKSTGPAPDYQALSGTREFRPGEPTFHEIRVPIFGDQLIEGSEANRSELFDVRLSDTSNATLAVATGTGTILDDADTLVGVIVKDKRQVEGNAGNSAMTFELELSGASPQAVTFQASTRSGTAASGTDFVRLNNQTITIPAQATTSTVTVQLIGDNGFEGGATESFFVVLDNPSTNLVLVDPEARGTIYNDDLLQVNAQTVKYIDADGDVATVRLSQGFLTVDSASSAGVLIFSAVNSIGGRSLQVIDLAGRGEFKGTSISVTAEKQTGFPGGLDGTPSDGNVNVGFIRAAIVQNATLEFTNGIDLGRVVVEGDLGKIVAGDKVIPTAVGTLDVLSFGAGKVALPFSDDLGERTSAILTTINQVIVRGDFEGNLRVIGDQFGTIHKLRVDGAFKGGSDDGAALGQIFFTGVLGKAQFGSIAGGGVQNSALITGDFASGARIGSLKVLGDITGGAGQDSALIVATKIKSVTIGGSLEGGAGSESGSIISGSKIKTVKISEDLRGGAGSGSGTIQASGDVQQIKLGNFTGEGTPVNGNLVGSTGNESGRIQVNGNLHSLRIGGDVTGGSGNITGGVDVGGRLNKAQLDGDLRGGNSTAGGSLTNSGFIAAGRIEAMILKGDLVAGTRNGTFIGNAGAIRATDTIGKLTIEGAVLGNAANAAIISAGGNAHDLAIKRLEIGSHARFVEILAGYSPQVEGQGSERGRLLSADAQIDSVEIAGEVEAINIVAGAAAGADGLFGTDDDSVIASSSGAVIDRNGVVSRIAEVVLRGIIVANDQAHGIVAQHVAGITTGSAGTPVPLAKGPGNDLAERPDILIGENFRALELPLPA